MVEQHEAHVELVPIASITIANPRVRNKRSFRELVDSIAAVGLKKPITVSRRSSTDGGRYDLVCGQGRLEAFQALGQAHIPAFIIEANPQESMIKSLVENCARRQHQALDLLHDIGGLKERGYTDTQIATKTGLTSEYVRGIARLLAKGEQRLLRAVESGKLPISVAIDIAEADGADVQNALQQAYENNLLRGRKLLVAKRLVENRRRRGKGLNTGGRPGRSRPISSDALVRAYKESTERKRQLVRKADITRNGLTFMAAAFRSLLEDEHFVTLLRAEALDTMPRSLANRIERGEVA